MASKSGGTKEVERSDLTGILPDAEIGSLEEEREIERDSARKERHQYKMDIQEKERPLIFRIKSEYGNMTLLAKTKWFTMRPR